MIAFLLEEAAKGGGGDGRGGGFGIVIVIGFFWLFLTWMFGPTNKK